MIGPAAYIDVLFMVHQQVAFCVSSTLQEGIAVALEQSMERNYFPQLCQFFQKKRDSLLQVLAGTQGLLRPITPEGSYFILADTARIPDRYFWDASDSSSRDFQLCRWMTREIGVVCLFSVSPLTSRLLFLPLRSIQKLTKIWRKIWLALRFANKTNRLNWRENDLPS